MTINVQKGLIFIKVIVVAIPSYTAALLTEKVTIVVPTIAMFMLIANSIESGLLSNRNRLDDDGAVDDEDDGGDFDPGEDAGGA